jgi:hypothetical protein
MSKANHPSAKVQEALLRTFYQIVTNIFFMAIANVGVSLSDTDIKHPIHE